MLVRLLIFRARSILSLYVASVPDLEFIDLYHSGCYKSRKMGSERPLSVFGGVVGSP